jgi:hypothetical protein
MTHKPEIFLANCGEQGRELWTMWTMWTAHFKELACNARHRDIYKIQPLAIYLF